MPQDGSGRQGQPATARKLPRVPAERPDPGNEAASAKRHLLGYGTSGTPLFPEPGTDLSQMGCPARTEAKQCREAKRTKATARICLCNSSSNCYTLTTERS